MQQPSVIGLWRGLGSLRLTPWGMAVLAGGVLATYRYPQASVLWVAGPLCLLAVNLVAAMGTHPRFRRQVGLLMFHLCLLAVILLAAAGRLTRLDAQVELVEGQGFAPDEVTTVSRGPWHPWRLDRVSFQQGPVEVDYFPGLSRGHTRSRVFFTGRAGGPAAVDIGDDKPLKAAGYRFYTTSNKGYAVLLTWLEDGVEPQFGAVHLPSYPLLDWKQENRWTTPRGQELRLRLQLPRLSPVEQSWTLRSSDVNSRLLIAAQDRDVELMPGQTTALEGGRLRFDGLRLWMGYRIFFDPALPWLFAAAVAGVLSLAWHFREQYGRHPLPQGTSTVGTDTGHACRTDPA